MVEILLAGILLVLVIIARNLKLIGEKLPGTPDRKSNSKKEGEGPPL
ncbi:hypothetical protein [Halobacillus litoralis]|nr:hypothetical protein [Halobacillus litoralis]